jgi:hypothetical protein
MNITRIVVKSEKSMMTSATGDVRSGVELEVTLTPDEAANPEVVSQILKFLQDNADAAVETNIRSKLS